MRTAFYASVTARKGLLAVLGVLLLSATASGAASGAAPPVPEKASPFGASTVPRTLSRIRATTVRDYYVTVELVRGVLASVDGLGLVYPGPAKGLCWVVRHTGSDRSAISHHEHAAVCAARHAWCVCYIHHGLGTARLAALC